MNYRDAQRPTAVTDAGPEDEWPDSTRRQGLGTWATEAESAAALDTALGQVGLWTVYREVVGTLTQPRPGQHDRTVRIDRLLWPTPRLLDLGWVNGAVGIEVKKSGTKIGPPIAQAMDYGRSVWTLPGGIGIWLNWVFLWPFEPQSGTVASIMAQHRIGVAYSYRWASLHLKSGAQNVIRVNSNGRIDIGLTLNGNKTGSR